MLINLIHDVDLLQMLIGPITRVHAEKAPSTRGYAVEEGAAITLRFANGAVGTFLVLDNAPSPHTMEQGTGENEIFPFAGQDAYRIFGTKGALSVPDNVLSTSTTPERGWYSAIEREKLPVESTVDDAFERQLANFVAVVRGSEEPVCSGEEGLRAVAVCEAVRKSLRTGLPVDVDMT